LCASQLGDDQAGFGWINPRLYQNPGLFFDIIGDSNSNNAVGKSCPSTLPPVNETCPAENSIAKAYLTYDRSLGGTIFVDIKTKTTDVPFVLRTIKTNESISFGFDDTFDSDFNFTFENFKEVSIIVSNLDPDQGGSTIIISETLSTSCPGPWTIGSTIASGFVLNGFLNYDIDTGTESNINEANGKFFGFEATEGWVSKKYTIKDDNCTTKMNHCSPSQ
jgi:hypothetical protein